MLSKFKSNELLVSKTYGTYIYKCTVYSVYIVDNFGAVQLVWCITALHCQSHNLNQKFNCKCRVFFNFKTSTKLKSANPLNCCSRN